MSVDFNREVDRRSTSDVKWRPEGCLIIRAFLKKTQKKST